jgi:pimeloyl-ACP methyl ester carboxylesterase
VPYVDVEDGQLWYDRAGAGEPVVLLHEGITDRRIWDDVVPLLTDAYDVIAYDQRGYGRSTPWSGPYSPVEDLRSLLDALGLDRVALVGASRGGRISVDFALTYPGRVRALALVVAGLGGHPLEIGTEDQDRRWEEASARGDLQGMADIDLEVWAPLGADERIRQMVYDNAEASNADDPEVGAEPPAAGRLGELAVPTLVVTADRDEPAINQVGDVLERGIAGARREWLADADHVAPLRKPRELADLLRGFLGS